MTMTPKNKNQRPLPPHVSIQPIPSLLRRVLERYHTEKTLDQQALSWICHDPCMSSHVLRAVNSTFNGFPRQLTSVHQSLKLLGPQLLQRLLADVEDKSSHAAETSLPHLSEPWRCALKTAVFAEQLASCLEKTTGLIAPEEAFSAGLLHNIGDFAKQGHFPVLSSDDIDSLDATPELLGMQLAQQWNFSQAMQAVMMHHKSPHLADESQDLVMVVAIAKRFIQDMTLSPSMFEWLHGHIGLEEDDFYTWRERFIAEAEERYDSRLRWVSSL